MTKICKKADTVVKLTLAVSVIIFYFTHIIDGPFARVITLLAVLTVLIFVIRFVYKWTSNLHDRS